MFKYRNLVRNQTRISDTEPKSDSEIPVWTPDSVHHKHKRHSSLNDVPHNHSATLPPLCMSEDTGTMTETSPPWPSEPHLTSHWKPGVPLRSRKPPAETLAICFPGRTSLRAISLPLRSSAAEPGRTVSISISVECVMSLRVSMTAG